MDFSGRDGRQGSIGLVGGRAGIKIQNLVTVVLQDDQMLLVLQQFIKALLIN